MLGRPGARGLLPCPPQHKGSESHLSHVLAGSEEAIAERERGRPRRPAGRHRPWIHRCRSLSSAGEARWRLRRRSPIEKRGPGVPGLREIGGDLRVAVRPRCSWIAPPALARNPSALSGATHHRSAASRPPPYIPPTPRAAPYLISRLAIDPSPDETKLGRGVIPSKQVVVSKVRGRVEARKTSRRRRRARKVSGYTLAVPRCSSALAVSVSYTIPPRAIKA
ncbi:hypothetical protein BS78_06G172100 [Paspalum vaginatum]|nr:hypothetical protein BS78_06G172100 [Paspalum vaginatum]